MQINKHVFGFCFFRSFFGALSHRKCVGHKTRMVSKVGNTFYDGKHFPNSVIPIYEQ